MTRKIILGIAGLVVMMVVVITVNTLRIGPPPPPEIPAAEDIAIDKDAAAKRLAQAVRYRTVSHGPNDPVAGEVFHALRDFVARSFPRVHRTLKREIVNDYSLLYTWEGNDPQLKPILLAAHLDVVPVEPGTETNWTHPPFSGDIANGFVWGRGTLDMKHSLMGLLEAVEYLLGQGFKPKRTVYLAFGHDEEIGGAGGAAKIADLLAQRSVRLHFTLDEGSVIVHDIIPGIESPVALIGLAEKGYVTVELAVELDPAKCGHSSMPPRSTAVGKLARAIHRLETNQMPAMLKSPVTEMFEFLAPEVSFGTRMVLANRWLLGPVLLSHLEKNRATNALIRTTTAPTIVDGGVKENVLPCKAMGIVNFRILPGDSTDKVIEHVRNTINDPDITIQKVGEEPSEPSLVSDSDSASFATLLQTVQQIFPDAVVAPSLVIVRTDSRRYTSITENSYRFIPVRMAPEDLARIHGTDERIAVDNYVEIIRFYIRLLRNTAVK